MVAAQREHGARAVELAGEPDYGSAILDALGRTGRLLGGVGTVPAAATASVVRGVRTGKASEARKPLNAEFSNLGELFKDEPAPENTEASLPRELTRAGANPMVAGTLDNFIQLAAMGGFGKALKAAETELTPQTFLAKMRSLHGDVAGEMRLGKDVAKTKQAYQAFNRLAEGDASAAEELRTLGYHPEASLKFNEPVPASAAELRASTGKLPPKTYKGELPEGVIPTEERIRSLQVLNKARQDALASGKAEPAFAQKSIDSLVDETQKLASHVQENSKTPEALQSAQVAYERLARVAADRLAMETGTNISGADTGIMSLQSPESVAGEMFQSGVSNNPNDLIDALGEVNLSLRGHLQETVHSGKSRRLFAKLQAIEPKPAGSVTNTLPSAGFDKAGNRIPGITFNPAETSAASEVKRQAFLQALERGDIRGIQQSMGIDAPKELSKAGMPMVRGEPLSQAQKDFLNEVTMGTMGAYPEAGMGVSGQIKKELGMGTQPNELSWLKEQIAKENLQSPSLGKDAPSAYPRRGKIVK